MVAEGIVELVSDAETFGDARLALENLKREERQNLKSEIRRSQKNRRAPVPMKRDRSGKQERLNDDPRQAGTTADARAELHGDQHEERAFESIAQQQNDDDDRRRLHRQQPEPRRADT